MASIKEVAKLAGVSIGTVDRVLHERGRVSEETCKKVRAAVKELGYVPDLRGRALASRKTYKIGVFMPKATNDYGYWGEPLRGIEQAQKRADVLGIKFTYQLFDRYKPSQALKILNHFAKAPCDAYICTGILYETLKNNYKVITEKPHIVYDTQLPQTPNRLVFFGQDSLQSGNLAGKLMSLMLPDGGKILASRVAEENEHACLRIKGFMEYLNKHGNKFEVTENRRNADNPAELKRYFINKRKEYKGVFLADSAIGEAAETLEDISPSPSMIGFDLTDKTIKYIKKGKIHFTITQNPYLQGYQAAGAAIQYLSNGEKPKDSIVYMPIGVVTQENLSSFIG